MVMTRLAVLFFLNACIILPVLSPPAAPTAPFIDDPNLTPPSSSNSSKTSRQSLIYKASVGWWEGKMGWEKTN